MNDSRFRAAIRAGAARALRGVSAWLERLAVSLEAGPQPKPRSLPRDFSGRSFGLFLWLYSWQAGSSGYRFPHLLLAGVGMLERYIQARDVDRTLGIKTATSNKWRQKRKGPKGWVHLGRTCAAYTTRPKCAASRDGVCGARSV